MNYTLYRIFWLEISILNYNYILTRLERYAIRIKGN